VWFSAIQEGRKVLELTREQAAELVLHAEQQVPHECCGLLAGRDGRVERVYRGTNVDHSPYTYLMDPREQLAAFKDMEAAGLDLLAIYHSHTHTPAYPSRTDIAKAYYPDALYLIVSLANREAPEIRAFRLADGKISEEQVVVR
jgi:[CysO sulfur-carrier protein]-S-L-cysteine hydrolase